ncbi:MAG: dephospho-CoA kinase [Acidobacteria bacterium]|nr:dephospho-CoA kinase [Acidobacteriota bacterium]
MRVGLTGGIATGKSYVTARLREYGLPVIDADQLARDAVAPASDGLRAVVGRFGPGVLDASGALDRSALGAIVFADRLARTDLEAIIHPEVRQRIEAWFEDLAAGGYRGPAIADIPLLFETGRTHQFDFLVVVACDPATQRKRLMARDGLSGEDADARLAAQWPIAKKVEAADRVVKTDGTFADTDVQIAVLARWLRSVEPK